MITEEMLRCAIHRIAKSTKQPIHLLYQDFAKGCRCKDWNVLCAKLKLSKSPAPKSSATESNKVTSSANPNDVFTQEDGLPVLTRGNVCIHWVNLGEGREGDYDEDDPNDVNLLRFDTDICINGVWEAVTDGSYCTRMRASTDHDILRNALVHIMNRAAYDIETHGKAKRILESMSWISAKFLPE